MSDRQSFSSDNFYVGSDNVRCPTVILSTAVINETIHGFYSNTYQFMLWKRFYPMGKKLNRNQIISHC